jgi:hypothetical protein
VSKILVQMDGKELTIGSLRSFLEALDCFGVDEAVKVSVNGFVYCEVETDD